MFEALADKYGNIAATYHMAEFAEGGESAGDFFNGFTVGTKPGRNAARHFFWSAVIAGESNSAVAWLAGLAKEGYDLLGGEIPRMINPRLTLPGAGYPARQDLAANEAGRRFVRELQRRQQPLPFLQLDRSPVNLSDYTQF